MGTVRAELAFPLENRGWGAGRGRARGRGGGARARHRARCSTARRTSCPAASCSASRSAPRSPAARALRAARRADLAARPGRRRRAARLLRRLNEEWGTAVVLAEHRLERCLAAADRVVALRDGAVACDADAARLPRLGRRRAPALQTPGARLFALAGLTPPPVAVKEARAALRARGLRRRPPGAAGRRARPPRAPSAAARRAAPRRSRFDERLARARAAGRRSCAASTSRSRRASASR